jgi:hypothetical protein
MASFSERRIALERMLASGVNAVIVNSSPATNTVAKPSCQDKPIDCTIVYVKNALTPIPGTKIIGAFAYNPMNTQPTKDVNTVASI